LLKRPGTIVPGRLRDYIELPAGVPDLLKALAPQQRQGSIEWLYPH
jgi:hypothetical protein